MFIKNRVLHKSIIPATFPVPPPSYSTIKDIRLPLFRTGQYSPPKPPLTETISFSAFCIPEIETFKGYPWW